MTQEEIKNYNKKCAEFIGFKCSINEQYELPNMMVFPPSKNSNCYRSAKVCCIEDMQFHSDWNWIMEVFIKIESLNYDVSIFTTDVLIKTDVKFIVTTNTGKPKTKLEAVVQAINKFLIFYNENNK